MLQNLYVTRNGAERGADSKESVDQKQSAGSDRTNGTRMYFAIASTPITHPKHPRTVSLPTAFVLELYPKCRE